MSIRWNIKDRADGKTLVVHQPSNAKDRDNLSSVIKNCSAVGISEQGRYRATHR